MRLQGMVAVVTGAGRGIGRAIAERLCQDGAAVVIAEIDSEAGTQTARDLTARGHRVRFIPCDITSEAEVARAMKEVVAELGRLDILVNNAGANTYFEATSMTEAEWHLAMGVNLKGAWLCCKHAIPHLRAAGGGSITNIASIHALVTARGMFPYAAAKSGLVGMTRSLALDHGPDQIRVNAICPGWIRTRLVDGWLDRQADRAATESRVLALHPLGRMGEPRDVANLVAFLASEEASFITGAVLVIDGGVTARLPY